MKLRVVMKDPDALSFAVEDAVRTELADSDLPEKESDALFDERVEAYRTLASDWFKYDEYLTIEIDTENRTASVVRI